MEIESHELLDYGSYPEITAHGIADVCVYGSMTEIVYFRWKRMEGIWRRVVSGVAFRPTDSVIPSFALFEAAIHRGACLAQH